MVETYKQKFNKRYNFPLDTSHSRADLSKISIGILNQVYSRGVGARETNPQSVRNAKTGKKVGGKSLQGTSKMSGPQWGQARIYSFLMGGKARQTADKERPVDQGFKKQ